MKKRKYMLILKKNRGKYNIISNNDNNYNFSLLISFFYFVL